ncbi:MAG TPA: iron uptake porin, partial [Kamptonema sp.]|nr:iron uptake porin [Kamptonema sp.]
MQKTSKLALFVSQSILTLGWLANFTPAIAQEVPLNSELDPNFPSQLATDSPFAPESNPGIKRTDTPTPLANSEDLTDSTDAMKQVTSVSQLSDVQPTDWAFQALQSLVERYGCIAGYPDGTFRGNRALTRYEFAAGLNACLDQISQQIGTATANLANKEDLVKLQKLQEEFAAELATLRGRVDALESRTAELEANQFSTTTKLYGLTFFNLTDTRATGKIKAEGTSAFTASRDANGRPIQRRLSGDTETTFSYLTWLSLVTSFTGKDTLLMVLAAGNGNAATNQL